MGFIFTHCTRLSSFIGDMRAGSHIVAPRPRVLVPRAQGSDGISFIPAWAGVPSELPPFAWRVSLHGSGAETPQSLP